MTIIEGVDGLWWAQIDHNTALFSSDDVSKLLTDYTMLLEAATQSPELRIENLPATSLATRELRASGLEASGVGANSNAPAERDIHRTPPRSTISAKRSSNASVASLPAEEK